MVRFGVDFGAPGRRTGHDVMQVCRNGHNITSMLESEPSRGKAFCPDCGGGTLSACPSCSKSIPGNDWDAGFVTLSELRPPNFCQYCGAPFPWTAERLAVADEMISDLDRLNAEDRGKLSQDLTSDTGRTELGVSRFRKIAAKAGVAVGSGLYKVAIDVATDAAKKGLLGS
jgi:hypothetical protein